MKAVHRDKESVSLVPESLEDLWALTKIVAEGDEASASSLRRVKSLDLARSDSGEKKRVRVRIRVERVELAENANKLRVTGVILSGEPEEFVQAGEYHTIDVEPGEKLTLYKQLNAFEKAELDEAVKRRKRVRACLTVLDEHHALVAQLSDRLKFVCEISSYASKRDPKGFAAAKTEFYGQLTQALKQQEVETFVIAGPGFAKDDFIEWLKQREPSLAAKVVTAHASTAEKSGLNELLKGGSLERVVAGKRLQEDYAAVEEFMKRVSKGGLVCYGFEEVKRAVEARAADGVLISDALLRRGNPFAREANALLDAVKRQGGSFRILDSQSEAGLEFESFKIAALLRYRL